MIATDAGVKSGLGEAVLLSNTECVLSELIEPISNYGAFERLRRFGSHHATSV